MKKFDRVTAFCITFGPALILTGSTAFAAIGGTMLFVALVLALYKLDFSREVEKQFLLFNKLRFWFFLLIWSFRNLNLMKSPVKKLLRIMAYDLWIDKMELEVVRRKEEVKHKKISWYIENGIWLISAIVIILGVFILAETALQASEPYEINHFTPITEWFWRWVL